jgi:hypothetical protein
MRVEFGKARCRLHGGLSTGPKTEAGRTRIAEAQRRRWRAYREGRKGAPRGPTGADLTAVFNFIGQRVSNTRVNLRVRIKICAGSHLAFAAQPVSKGQTSDKAANFGSFRNW